MEPFHEKTVLYYSGQGLPGSPGDAPGSPGAGGGPGGGRGHLGVKFNDVPIVSEAIYV